MRYLLCIAAMLFAAPAFAQFPFDSGEPAVDVDRVTAADDPKLWFVDLDDFSTVTTFMMEANQVAAQERSNNPLRAKQYEKTVADYLLRKVVGQKVRGQLQVYRISEQHIIFASRFANIEVKADKQTVIGRETYNAIVFTIGKQISAEQTASLNPQDNLEISATVKEIQLSEAGYLAALVLANVKLVTASEAPATEPFGAKTSLRTFSDVSGKFKTDAEFVGLINGNVHLRRASDSKVVIVPLKSFSETDRVWIAGEIIRRQKQPSGQ